VPISPELLARPTYDEVRGQNVRLTGLDPATGENVEADMDAAEAWADLQQRRNNYRMLLECLTKG
jgi:hypothetical protein